MNLADFEVSSGSLVARSHAPFWVASLKLALQCSRFAPHVFGDSVGSNRRDRPLFLFACADITPVFQRPSRPPRLV